MPELRCKLVRGRNDSRYEQFEISPKTIEQELRPVVCARQTDKPDLTLEVTNDNFHGVHRLELYIVAFLKNHCIANTGPKNINKIPLCC